jgi:hypothetical protein
MFARHLPFRADVRESSRRQPFPAAGKWQVWGIPCTIAVIAACSQEATQSCNSCHDLEAYGVDGARTSTGNGGARGTRNAPTVYTAAGFVAQFWDGRAATVEEQAKGPILNSSEMAMRSPAEVMTRVSGIPGYEADFKQAFSGDPDPMTFDNLANAIGAFERKLVTPGRWDRFLDGDTAQLSPEETAGLRRFSTSDAWSATPVRFSVARCSPRSGSSSRGRTRWTWALRSHQGRARQDVFQSPHPSKHREDGALLP